MSPSIPKDNNTEFESNYIQTFEEQFDAWAVESKLNTSVSLSKSLAETIPILNWFSSALKLSDEIIGALSLRLFIAMVTSFDVVNSPSATETNREYEFFV